MKKRTRQTLIADILKRETIGNQSELVEALRDKGIEVTQATISRDIKEMKLIKTKSKKGTFHYRLPETSPSYIPEELGRLLSGSLVHVSYQRDKVLLKTTPGSATAIARIIEEEYLDYLFTVMTDEDKVLLFCLDKKEAYQLYQSFSTYVIK